MISVPACLLHSSALPTSFCEVPHTFQGSTKVVKHRLLHQTLSPVHLSIQTSIHPSPSAQLSLRARAHTLLEYFSHHIPGDIIVTAQKLRVQIWPFSAKPLCVSVSSSIKQGLWQHWLQRAVVSIKWLNPHLLQVTLNNMEVRGPDPPHSRKSAYNL